MSLRRRTKKLSVLLIHSADCHVCLKFVPVFNGVAARYQDSLPVESVDISDTTRKTYVKEIIGKFDIHYVPQVFAIDDQGDIIVDMRTWAKTKKLDPFDGGTDTLVQFFDSLKG